MKKTASNTEKALRGMSSQTIVTIVLGIVEIVSFSIMSRLLTQEDFGYYAALSAILIVFNSFAETGIGSAIIQRKNADQHFINNAFTLSFVFGSVLSILLFALSDVLARTVVDSSMSTPLRLMSLTIICHCLTSPFLSILQKNLKFLTVGLINLISLVITTAIAVVFAINGFGYYAIIAKTVLSSILTLVGAAILSKVKFSFSWDTKVIKSIWNYSGWLMASVVFRNFAQQCDRLLMSRLLSVEALGSYNRPKEFINQISSKLNGIFDTALFPVLSDIQDNMQSLQRAFMKSIYLMNLFSSMLAMAFIFNAELILRIFFGSDWLNLTGLFQVLSIALFFNILGRLSDCYLRSLAFTKAQFYFRLSETIIQFAGIIFGAIWGVYGVAIAVVLSNVLMVFIKLFYITSRIGLKNRLVVLAILRSHRYLLFFAPPLIMAIFIFPHTIVNNIIILVLFVLLSIILFLFIPKLVGGEYQKDIYPKIRKILFDKIMSLRRN